MSPITATSMRNDRMMGFVASFFGHALLLVCGGLALVKPIEYAVESGSGGVEISLTAAPVETASADEAVVQEAPKAIEEPIVKDPEEMVLPQNEIEEIKKTEIKTEEKPKQVQTAVNSEFKGDGSSAIPGKDSTTFYSQGGAITEAKPNYLKNPAPYYPWEARQKGWEGVIILKVSVDKSGYPVKIEKEKSSGYGILDESALKTVRTWRFHPAQIGALSVESFVRVPIRFELESLRRK